ncbi:unnamed protein product [Effrenium voratum]|uniref:Uncharacterized protein n=1 Tax=Effrenium voratum TaxID=2562239 RepID=A0AA36NH15_9DINO|nr:unnamed protein product [Effrenium voratum]
MASHDAPKVSKQLQGTIISVRKAGGDPVELVGEVALRALKRKPGAVPVRALASRGDRGQSLPWGERIASHEGSSEWVLDAGRHNVASTGRAGSAERAALPQAAPARQVTPKQASPRQASPRQASPRQASPRQASPRQASPEHAAPERPSSPDHAASPDRTASTERESSAEPTGDERDDPGRRSTDSEDSTAPETHLPGTLTVEPQASIEADDVEDMPRTTPKFSERPSTADSWSRSTGRILDLLDKHSKFKRTALRARRRYFSNAWLATRLALWVVLLGVPIIVYPIAVFFESWSLRSQKYMASYGMALSNFCYILAPSLGASVRYTLEGIIGTMLALLNMLLLNQMTGSYMSGGAYQTRSEVLDPVTGATLYRSDWLPLCNLGNGARFVQTNSTADFMQNCFLNVHWSSLTPDAAKALIITLDLTIFHGVILWAGFGLCVRLYGFTYLAYWLMLFVTPTSDAFIENPSDPWTQAIMTCVGGCLAVLSQILPCPNDALSKATKSAAELVESVSAILEALPHASSRAMSAYNYGAAVTVAVVVANTTEAGFSLSLIMRRLNSAVIGTVLGQAAQQVLAVQTEFHATLYGIFLFCFAVFLIFQILHSKEHASTAMPVLGIGALALVPATGVFRVYNSQIEVEAEISLASSVKATVFGGTIMLIIDLLLYSSARSSAQKQLEKAMAKIQGLLSRVMGLSEKEDITENVDGSSNEEEKVLAYLNQVRGLLPHALAEPAPRGIEFPYALFSSVEGSLRTVASEMGTLEWMFDTLLAHSSSTALMGKEELAPLLSDIESYLTQMLSTVQVMYKDVSSRNFQPAGESGGDTAAGMLRQEILEKNYARISQAAKEIKPLVAQTRRLSGLAQAVLRNKDGNEGAGFPELLQRLRESSKDARGLTPMQDMLSQVELLVSILGTVSKQVVNIQLVLAQYG